MRGAATYLAILLALGVASACQTSEVSRDLGAQCDDKRDCDERCLSGGEFPDGLCTRSCESDADCPAFARCIDEEGGVCLYRCELPVDCEFLGSNWTCKDKDRREAAEEEVPVCVGQ